MTERAFFRLAPISECWNKHIVRTFDEAKDLVVGDASNNDTHFLTVTGEFKHAQQGILLGFVVYHDTNRRLVAVFIVADTALFSHLKKANLIEASPAQHLVTRLVDYLDKVVAETDASE